MCRIDEFWNIHETFPRFFFSKQAKLRQPHRAETADFRFQISNFEIRQTALLHFVAFFHVASLFSTGVDNKKVGVDNEKALEHCFP